MTLQEIIAALQDRNLAVVSKRTGIHHNSLVAIKNGQVKTPNPRTLAALETYLRPQE